MSADVKPAHDPDRQSKPAVRWLKACGSPGNVSQGRAAVQMGWYQLVAQLAAADWARTLDRGSPSQTHRTMPTILDVGAGLGNGVRLLNGAGFQAVGIDIDPALADAGVGYYTNTEDYADREWDYVCAIDVIEHVIDDLDFLRELLRMARRGVYVSTPNELVSKCGNPHHCRELTPGEFLNWYRPDKLWLGAADGSAVMLAAEWQPESVACYWVHTRGGIVSMSIGQFDTFIGGQRTVFPNMLGAWDKT